MTPNCNMYQFLIENCMKGIAHAVLFQKGFIEQKRVALMLKILESANPGSILPVAGRQFDLEELSQILMRQNDRLNMLYTKHFYGFEKEGKCDTYNEKQVVSNVFNFRYPVNQYEIQDKLQPCIGLGLTDIDYLLPKSEETKRQEERDAAALAERIANMTPLEKRKYDREQKRKERIEEDLEPERQMAAGMEQLKKTLQTSQAPASEEAKTAVMFERLRGIVLNEADDT